MLETENLESRIVKSDYKILLQAKEDSEKFLLDEDPKNKELKDYLISSIERG